MGKWAGKGESGQRWANLTTRHKVNDLLPLLGLWGLCPGFLCLGRVSNVCQYPQFSAVHAVHASCKCLFFSKTVNFIGITVFYVKFQSIFRGKFQHQRPWAGCQSSVFKTLSRFVTGFNAHGSF